MTEEFDWKKLIGTVAPTIGTMLGGPLVGTAVGALSDVFLGKPDGSQEEIAKAIKDNGLTPETITALKKLDNDHKENMTRAGIDLEKINAAVKVEMIKDVQDARKLFNDKIYWLGVIILSIFAITMIMCLYGSYIILKGGIQIEDVSAVAAVSGFIGTVVGYIAANAQQVVGYFYGSSAGSDKKSDALAHSISSIASSVK